MTKLGDHEWVNVDISWFKMWMLYSRAWGGGVCHCFSNVCIPGFLCCFLEQVVMLMSLEVCQPSFIFHLLRILADLLIFFPTFTYPGLYVAFRLPGSNPDITSFVIVFFNVEENIIYYVNCKLNNVYLCSFRSTLQNVICSYLGELSLVARTSDINGLLIFILSFMCV